MQLLLIIIVIIIFNRGNRKFFHFNSKFYQTLEASCWQPYWILYRSPIIVCHYGRVKTIRGIILVQPAIFQGINGTTGKRSNSERQIRVCVAMLNNLNLLLTLQSKTSVQKKQKMQEAEFSPSRFKQNFSRILEEFIFTYSFEKKRRV